MGALTEEDAMWNHQKGYMKDIPLAGGVLSVTGTFNPLDLDGDERTLVFAIVDLLREFGRAQPHPVGPDGTVERNREPSIEELSGSIAFGITHDGTSK